MNTKNPFYESNHWRERAEKTRVKADLVWRDANQKRKLLRVAEDMIGSPNTRSNGEQPIKRKATSIGGLFHLANVTCWPEADMPADGPDVRFRR